MISDYENALPPGGWPNWVLGNHDQPRIAARVGAAQARVAAMLLLTLRGTPTMYYGDEVGLARVDVPPNLVQDTWEKNEPGLGVNRDPSRTPFHWDASANAGFTTGRPWLPIDGGYRHQNADVMAKEETSLLNLYRRLISIRKLRQTLSTGEARRIVADGDVLSYERCCEAERLLVALNLGNEDRALRIPGSGSANVLLSTYMDREGVASELTIRANEGLILRLD